MGAQAGLTQLGVDEFAAMPIADLLEAWLKAELQLERQHLGGAVCVCRCRTPKGRGGWSPCHDAAAVGPTPLL